MGERAKPVSRLVEYHRVPAGWHAHEIALEHAKLGGTYDLSGPEATEPGAPAWMPERHAWLQYRQMLYRISEGISAGDAASIELAVRFIELRYIGSYSGYLRSRFYRRLRRAPLMAGQARRLDAHFWSLAFAGIRSHEFKDYLPLWHRVFDTSALPSRMQQLAIQERGEERAAWLSRALWPDTSLNPTRFGGRLDPGAGPRKERP